MSLPEKCTQGDCLWSKPRKPQVNLMNYLNLFILRVSTYKQRTDIWHDFLSLLLCCLHYIITSKTAYRLFHFCLITKLNRFIMQMNCVQVTEIILNICQTLFVHITCVTPLNAPSFSQIKTMSFFSFIGKVSGTLEVCQKNVGKCSLLFYPLMPHPKVMYWGPWAWKDPNACCIFTV